MHKEWNYKSGFNNKFKAIRKSVEIVLKYYIIRHKVVN